MAKVSTIHVHLIIFKLFTNCRATWGTPQHRQCRCWWEIQANQTLRNAGDWYRDWTNHASGQRARLSPESTRRSSVQKIGENAGHCNRPKQNPRRGRNIPGMQCSRKERTTSQGPFTEIQCARLAWHYITRQRKRF